jgi:hypothetical protein
MPLYCDDVLTSPDSVLTTAEDSLPIIPRTKIRRVPRCDNSSIATITPLGNVAIGRRRVLFSRNDLGRVRQAVSHRGENQTVIPPKAFSTTHWLEKKLWQDEPFR